MKRLVLLSAVLLTLSACNEPMKAPEPKSLSELNQESLDLVYASQDDYMKKGLDGLQANTAKLQSLLLYWPNDKTNNQFPCYMQLKIHTVRMLGLLDGLPAEQDERESDFKYDCRQSINYEYDQARSHQLWDKL